MTRKVKIAFELDPDDWHRTPVETLWAEAVVEDGRPCFQMMNSPFCVRGISFLDFVGAMPTKHDGMYNFAAVLKRSGHSTFMLLIKPDDVRSRPLWDQLERLGCSYESATEHLSIGVRTLYSVDVPPTADLSEVFRILKHGEREEVWMYQEGHVYRPESETQG
jgi:hypothetical protein